MSDKTELKAQAYRPLPESSTSAVGSADDAAYLGLFGDNEALRVQAERTSVSCVMSRGIVCLSADAPLEHVTQMLLERDIGSVPVVDSAWRPVGMVSKTDLLRVYADLPLARPDAGSALPGLQAPRGPATTVADITQPFVLSLHEESPVSVAAALMAYEGVHRLPIVASSGEVVGVVSTLDIVRWVARCTQDEPTP